jgi:hypothetical protein
VSPADRIWARARLDPAAWLLPVSALLGAMVVRDSDDPTSTYALAVAVDAHLCLFMLAAIGAGATAWKAGRLRRGGWTQRPWVRSPARIALVEATTTTALQLTAYGVVLAATGLRSAIGAVPIDGVVVATAAVVLLATSAAGWAAGWWIRTELAMPIVVLGTYLALVFPPAMEPLWLRHLTGLHDECCNHDEVLARPVTMAPIILGAGIVVAALLALTAARRPALGVAAAGVVVVAAVVAASLVDELDHRPSATRTGRAQCAGDRPVLCLWPEQADARPSVSAAVTEVVDRWAAAGIARPERVSTRPDDADAVTLILPLDEQVSPDTVRPLLAWAMVPELTEEACGDDGIPAATDDAVLIARAAFARLAGQPEEDLRAEFGEELLPQIRTVVRAEPRARVVWLEQVRAAALACADVAPPLP